MKPEPERIHFKDDWQYSEQDYAALGMFVVAYGRAETCLWDLAELVEVDDELRAMNATDKVERATRRRLDRLGLLDAELAATLDSLLRLHHARNRLLHAVFAHQQVVDQEDRKWAVKAYRGIKSGVVSDFRRADVLLLAQTANAVWQVLGARLLSVDEHMSTRQPP